ncbi:MAG: hypothetical protein AAF682_25375 [Planctomycetota bacterium]
MGEPSFSADCDELLTFAGEEHEGLVRLRLSPEPAVTEEAFLASGAGLFAWDQAGGRVLYGKREIKLLDLVTGAEKTVLTLDKVITQMVFDPRRGAFFLSHHGIIYTVEGDTCRVFRELEGRTIGRLRVSPDGRWLIAA